MGPVSFALRLLEEMIPAPISTGIPMSPRPIPFWNAWLDPAGSGRGIFCWTMAAARDGSGFFCPARPAAAPLASNMIRAFMKTLENQSSCVSSGRSSFVLANAEHYAVPSSVDRVYFFNPFSLELLQKVMARILNSYYEHPRSILLFFYYPSDSYLSYLTSVPEMAFFDEIPCGDLFPGNDPRETIMIFELPYPM